MSKICLHLLVLGRAYQPKRNGSEVLTGSEVLNISIFYFTDAQMQTGLDRTMSLQDLLLFWVLGLDFKHPPPPRARLTCITGGGGPTLLFRATTNTSATRRATTIRPSRTRHLFSQVVRSLSSLSSKSVKESIFVILN